MSDTFGPTSDLRAPRPPRYWRSTRSRGTSCRDPFADRRRAGIRRDWRRSLRGSRGQTRRRALGCPSARAHSGEEMAGAGQVPGQGTSVMALRRNEFGAVFGGGTGLLQPWKNRSIAGVCHPQRCDVPLEQRTGDLVSVVRRQAAEPDHTRAARRLDVYTSYWTLPIEAIAPQERDLGRRATGPARGGTRG